jgi:hypothetical protein
VPVLGQSGSSRRGSRRGKQHGHLGIYLPADNPTAGLATTVTQTGFMII